MTMLHGLSVQYVRNENKNVKRVLFLKNKKKRFNAQNENRK